MKALSLLLITAPLALALTACGSDSDDTPGGGGSSASSTVPENTQQAFTAFIEAKAYRSNGWVSETAAPRARDNTVSPHGRVRVWFNPTVVESQKAGNGADLSAPPHTVGSMVVKELYDDQDTLVGHAAFLKVDEGKGGGPWQYYCKGPNGRCYSGSSGLDETPMFAKGDLQCGGCHGGMVFTSAP